MCLPKITDFGPFCPKNWVVGLQAKTTYPIRPKFSGYVPKGHINMLEYQKSSLDPNLHHFGPLEPILGPNMDPGSLLLFLAQLGSNFHKLCLGVIQTLLSGKNQVWTPDRTLGSKSGSRTLILFLARFGPNFQDMCLRVI